MGATSKVSITYNPTFHTQTQKFDSLCQVRFLIQIRRNNVYGCENVHVVMLNVQPSILRGSITLPVNGPRLRSFLSLRDCSTERGGTHYGSPPALVGWLSAGRMNRLYTSHNCCALHFAVIASLAKVVEDGWWALCTIFPQ